MRFIISLFFIFCLFLSSSLAQTPLEIMLPVDPNVKMGRLSNGLTYYIRHNSKPEKIVQLRLVLNVGSVQEEDDQQGLAHFVEHMAFNGLEHFKKNELFSYMQSIGVRLGDLNANTGHDETIFILPVPTDKKEYVDTAFQVLEDWASGIIFDPQEIEDERGVVLEEMRQRALNFGKNYDREHPGIWQNTGS